MSPSDRIGFIGLGSMGVHMATNLQKTLAKSNRKLVVWNRTISKAESMKDTGVEIASSAEDVVDKADIIFVSMSKDEASLDLFEKLYAVHESGKGRKLTAEQPLIFLDTTTLYPTVGRDLEQRAEKVPNRYYLSMPVFGAPPAAAAAQLIVVTAGKELVKKKIEPYLVNVIGRVIIDCGTDIQKGFELKLVGNFFISGVVELLAEGMTLADKSGLTQEKLMEFINLMFPAVPFKGYGTKMVSPKTLSSAFTDLHPSSKINSPKTSASPVSSQ